MLFPVANKQIETTCPLDRTPFTEIGIAALVGGPILHRNPVQPRRQRVDWAGGVYDGEEDEEEEEDDDDEGYDNPLHDCRVPPV